MKSQSPKNAKTNRANAKWRREYVEEIGKCQMPDCTGEWPCELHVHEIGRGCHRQNAKITRIACLVVCDHCNQNSLCDYSVWSIKRQLALKVLRDPEHVDLPKFNVLCGKAPKYIEPNDIFPYILELLTTFKGLF